MLVSNRLRAPPAGLLADAIHQALAGHQPADQALARYQQRRDALTANEFELTPQQ